MAEDAFEVFRLFGLAQFIDTGYEITTQMWEAKDTAVQAYNGAKDKIADLYNRISDAVEERDIVQLYEEVQAARREAQEKLAELKEATEKIEKNLTRVMQSARDFFDGDLSRYDVEKYKNLIVSKINNNVDLIKENCPEVLGSVVKVLSYGDKVSDDVQSAVVKILENTESSHEVKWILRQTVDIYKTTREKGLKHGTDKFKEVAGEAIDLGLKKLDEKLTQKKKIL